MQPLRHPAVPPHQGIEPPVGLRQLSKAARLRQILLRPGLDFLLEAHSGLSARIAEEAGFAAVWASGLSIAASLGAREDTGADWAQVLEVLGIMANATTVPILVDADSGHGHCDDVGEFVRALEDRGLAGLCIEDRRPNTRGRPNESRRRLADVQEFCARLQAAKAARRDPAFSLVARVEAFVVGLGLDEALRRAEAYRNAGADAVMIQSALRHPEEVLAFQRQWASRCPVVIEPTKYHATPASVFRTAGISAAVWANHLLRASLQAMQQVAARLFADESIARAEAHVAPLSELLRLQGGGEPEAAETRYLPRRCPRTHGILLAPPQPDQGPTASRPAESPLERLVQRWRDAGVENVAIAQPQHDAAGDGGVLHALQQALANFNGPCVIGHGDLPCRRFVVQELLDTDDDFAVFVDADRQASRAHGHPPLRARCSLPMTRAHAANDVLLEELLAPDDSGPSDGEWIGYLKLSAAGTAIVRDTISEILTLGKRDRAVDLADVLRRLLGRGERIAVLYTTGNWIETER